MLRKLKNDFIAAEIPVLTLCAWDEEIGKETIAYAHYDFLQDLSEAEARLIRSMVEMRSEEFKLGEISWGRSMGVYSCAHELASEREG